MKLTQNKALRRLLAAGALLAGALSLLVPAAAARWTQSRLLAGPRPRPVGGGGAFRRRAGKPAALCAVPALLPHRQRPAVRRTAGGPRRPGGAAGRADRRPAGRRRAARRSGPAGGAAAAGGRCFRPAAPRRTGLPPPGAICRPPAASWWWRRCSTSTPGWWSITRPAWTLPAWTPPALLDRYRDYLGLASLGDWQETAAGTSASFWSPGGQVTLHCALDPGGLLLEAVCTPEEDRRLNQAARAPRNSLENPPCYAGSRKDVTGMKTRIFSAALAAVLVPALAACAAGGPASRGEASAGTATPQSAAADPGEAGSLQPLTPGTGQGYYVCGSNGGSPLLCYLQSSAASPAPTASTNSESCTAWLPAGRMVSNPERGGAGHWPGSSWTASRAGSGWQTPTAPGRRQLPALPDGFAAETLAAQDGQALYCCRQQVRGRPDHHRAVPPAAGTAARPSSC